MSKSLAQESGSLRRECVRMGSVGLRLQLIDDSIRESKYRKGSTDEIGGDKKSVTAEGRPYEQTGKSVDWKSFAMMSKTLGCRTEIGLSGRALEGV
ncbi:hypothetical protein CVT26_011320 [Gymnopilus dilepis]|uniref:Uncharacterized protein n=1 Tax=Gymnopilus dilepis TaxID=231916 RepID=A0A409YR20_9AGAR|nr:hypothetical protein CVT26_011320 [Gymnopilus dilepis]